MSDKETFFVCPRCDEASSEIPAMSRRDNKTEICSDCGVQEAMCDYLDFDNIPEGQMLLELRLQKKLNTSYYERKR